MPISLESNKLNGFVGVERVDRACALLLEALQSGAWVSKSRIAKTIGCGEKTVVNALDDNINASKGSAIRKAMDILIHTGVVRKEKRGRSDMYQLYSSENPHNQKLSPDIILKSLIKSVEAIAEQNVSATMQELKKEKIRLVQENLKLKLALEDMNQQKEAPMLSKYFGIKKSQ